MNMDLMGNVEKSIGESISAVRKLRKLTQRKFAEQLTERGMPVDASAVSRMEKGDRALRIAECLIIAEVLEVELDVLLRGIQTPSQELKETRRFADFCMHDMSESFANWVQNLILAKWQLEMHPDLLGQVSEDLDSHVEYLPWVASRVAELEWENEGDPGDSLILVRDQGEVDALIACVVAYAVGRIVPDVELDNGERGAAV